MQRQLGLVMLATLLISACDTKDIPPGNKGFMFDRTGIFALYIGGDGLLEDEILEPGTHFVGFYDEIRDVNCKDATETEAVSVLTRSDLPVQVDIRITFRADCDTKESLLKIINGVQSADGTVEPSELFQRYLQPVIRSSVRDRLAEVTIDQVKTIRGTLDDGVLEDLEKMIEEKGTPVKVTLLQLANIVLPPEITEKNKQIEMARQEAEQQREQKKASQVRLERELFEAQEDRKVQVETAEKEKEVSIVNAERDKQMRVLEAQGELEARKLAAAADLEVAIKEAEGIAALRAQLSAEYLRYLEITKSNEAKLQMAQSLAEGTKWYVDKDFLLAPDSSGKIAVSP
ncbi:MAG: SPFH domain-containing protein [Myxococcota bacterium]|jgi:regulator of protease activity HflC (stomatin/prohibitin superfamily)|nr:SPFH domain-containing protein [Myxococcota bacterium]